MYNFAFPQGRSARTEYYARFLDLFLRFDSGEMHAGIYLLRAGIKENCVHMCPSIHEI